MPHNSRSIRRSLLGATALAGALCVMTAGPAAAEDGAAFQFDQPSQPLASALRAYSATADQEIIFADALVAGRRAPQLKGSYTADGALMALLDGTGLTVSRTATGVLLVQRVNQDPQGGSAAGGGATVEALIVTAQKREEDIQDVPIAISAFTQEDLTRSQIAGGPDLITQVPNMTFTKTNFSSYSVQLRGIGTQAISATTDPAVAVAFNNTPFIRNRFFEQEFYDLQRVEVLRGPQGTLYGRNATAGVVNLISAKPKFYFEAKASADISNYSSSRIEGMVNVPLVEDMVALRIAGAWTKRDGYAFNELTGAPIDGRDLWSTRVSLRITPDDRFDANLIWEHFEEDDDRLRSGKQLCKKDVVTQVGDSVVTDYYSTATSGGQAGSLFAGVQATLSQGCKRNSLYARDSFQRPNGLMLPYYVPLGGIGLQTALDDPYVSVVNTSDPAVISATNDQPEDLRVIQSTIDPEYRAKSDIGELQISFDLTDTLTLTSETAYAVDQVWSLQDFNRFNTAPGAWTVNPGLVSRGVLDENGVFCDPQLGCSDRLVAVDISTAKASQFSQEFRLGSDFDGPFNFSLGANFLRADSEDKYYVFFNSIGLIAATAFSQNTGDYTVGETDNIECLRNGYASGDPNAAYGVQSCTYIDPNPIGALNDRGHNYFLSKNPYKLISYAVFGEAYYNVTDNLKVTAGLRWTVDKKEAPRVPTWVLITNSVGYPVAEVIEQEWREPTGRLTVDWKPDLSFTDETLLYASYAHGYKAGGANPPPYVRAYYANEAVALLPIRGSATRPPTFDPEFVDAFELGSKNTLADGRVTLNLAAFYYDYKGYQVSEIIDRSAFNRNFDATVWGVELEADWRPLENLRLGLKGGYEKTRIADGEQAIDLMDRTAGREDWVVVRPFPTFASSCVLPTFVFANPDGTIGRVGGVGGGGMGGCEGAYLLGLDPVTGHPYVDLTQNPAPSGNPNGYANQLNTHPGYPGWDPTLDYGNNNGEGFFKALGGNELPNAPNWTWTVTGDYTVPLAGDWLATLHTDLHWQSESWWRVFNDHEYNRLDEYFTMNLAAIFTNEEAGWNIMAYVKNVTDETAITGAFLFSDDTGLTTNVFLTEPRLYGLRATKTWSGGPLLGSFGSRHDGPYPFTLELGGQALRVDTPDQAVSPVYTDNFPAPLDIFDDAQNANLDWGDGREVRLIYRPAGGDWSVTASYRGMEANGHAKPAGEFATEPVCLFGGPVSFRCTLTTTDAFTLKVANYSQNNNSQAFVIDSETYQVADIAIRREAPFAGLSRSAFEAGLRHVTLDSSTGAEFSGVPDWMAPEGAFILPFSTTTPVTHTFYNMQFGADREFEGTGAVVSWDAAHNILQLPDDGRINLDWTVTGGVLWGEQQTAIAGNQLARTYAFTTLFQAVQTSSMPPTLTGTIPGPDIDIARSSNVTVPTLGATLGLSYTIDRFSIGAGYRWERYYDAIDGGYEERKDTDRTIDGPYLKISVGFGG